MFGKNKVPWIVAGVFILALGVGAVVLGKKEEPKPPPVPPESGRAVVLPANQARTVVVPACNTPVEQTASLAERGEVAPGASIVELPRGDGTRYVLVPHCQPTGQGVTSNPGNLPSALAVLAGGERPIEGRGGTFAGGSSMPGSEITARTQLLLPNGSPATIVVVPPCRKKTAGKRDVVLSGESQDARAVTAPTC